MNEWLTDSLTDWLAGWLAGWLTDWLAGWLTGWLAGWSVGYLTDWLTASIHKWMHPSCINSVVCYFQFCRLYFQQEMNLKVLTNSLSNDVRGFLTHIYVQDVPRLDCLILSNIFLYNECKPRDTTNLLFVSATNYMSLPMTTNDCIHFGSYVFILFFSLAVHSKCLYSELWQYWSF